MLSLLNIYIDGSEIEILFMLLSSNLAPISDASHL